MKIRENIRDIFEKKCWKKARFNRFTGFKTGEKLEKRLEND